MVSSFTTDNVGQFCSSGVLADLDPFMKKAGIDKDDVFPKTLLDYTQLRGRRSARCRCSADAYGLYYNKDAFEKAGHHPPPKTMSELESGRR